MPSDMVTIHTRYYTRYVATLQHYYALLRYDSDIDDNIVAESYHTRLMLMQARY